MKTLSAGTSVLIMLLWLSAGPGMVPAYGEEKLIEGKICYKVARDDSPSPRRTELEGEDEAVGKRPMQIRTRKARIVCDKALIRIKKLLK